MRWDAVARRPAPGVWKGLANRLPVGAERLVQRLEAIAGAVGPQRAAGAQIAH